MRNRPLSTPKAWLFSAQRAGPLKTSLRQSVCTSSTQHVLTAHQRWTLSDLLRRWHPYQSARSSQVSRPTCWFSTAPPWRHMSFMVRSTICRTGANQHAPDWNTRCQLGKPLKMGANEASAADTQVMLHGMYVNSSGAILSTHETGEGLGNYPPLADSKLSPADSKVVDSHLSLLEGLLLEGI